MSETNPTPSPAETQLLVAQRDALLAACKRIVDSFDGSCPENICSSDFEAVQLALLMAADEESENANVPR